MFFSPTTCEFYFQRDGAPIDLIKISAAQHQSLLDGISKGMQLAADSDGQPIIVEAQIVISVPERCTPAQGLIALFALKRITEADVLTAIGSIPDDDKRYTVQIGYQRATVWDRSSPTMQAIAQLLQLSEEDLDALYSYGVTVQV